MAEETQPKPSEPEVAAASGTSGAAEEVEVKEEVVAAAEEKKEEALEAAIEESVEKEGEGVAESVSFKEESNVVADLEDPEKKALDELKTLIQTALSNNEFTPPPPPSPPPAPVAEETPVVVVAADVAAEEAPKTEEEPSPVVTEEKEVVIGGDHTAGDVVELLNEMDCVGLEPGFSMMEKVVSLYWEREKKEEAVGFVRDVVRRGGAGGYVTGEEGEDGRGGS